MLVDVVTEQLVSSLESAPNVLNLGDVRHKLATSRKLFHCST